MSVEGHIEALQAKHEDLEKQLRDAERHPATDDLTLARLKKEKLKIKDELLKLGAA